jgi:hypothetical protein
VTRARYIHKRSRSAEAADILQAIFAAELISPSRALWLVSPWISNIPILDNRSNAFLSLEPAWGESRVRLATVLLKLASLGTRVVVATRPIDHNADFIAAIQNGYVAGGPRPVIHRARELHEKGILGDGYHLGGSMNITFNGISVNEEALHFQTDAGEVARTRVLLAQRWPGGLV